MVFMDATPHQTTYTGNGQRTIVKDGQSHSTAWTAIHTPTKVAKS